MRNISNTTKTRLLEFLKYLDLSQAKFADKVGLSKGFANNVGDSIRSENLKKITDIYPQLNTTWLLTGDGEMLKSEINIPTDNTDYSDLSSRIRQIMKYEQLNISQFAERSGIGQGNLSSMLNGNRSIGEGVLNKIIVTFEDINKDWLFDGKGEMLKSKHKQETMTQNNNEFIDYLKDTIREKDEEIGRLKEEIGRLKGILDKNNIEYRQTGS